MTTKGACKECGVSFERDLLKHIEPISQDAGLYRSDPLMTPRVMTFLHVESCDEFRAVVHEYAIGAQTDPDNLDFADWREPLAKAEKVVFLREVQKIHEGCRGKFEITENAINDEAVNLFKHYARKIIKGNSA